MAAALTRPSRVLRGSIPCLDTIDAPVTNEFLSSLAKSQDALLQAATTAVTQSNALPIVPAAQLPVPEFLAQAPTPRQMHEASFAFAEKFLAQQKVYAEKFIAVSEAASAATTPPRS
jgi:hypothetical protein